MEDFNDDDDEIEQEQMGPKEFKKLIKQGKNGLEKIDLTLKNNGLYKAEIYLHGAHLTSLKLDATEIIYLSQKAIFKLPTAIRGGIPIIFPQFGPLGSLQKHGFARNLPWTLVKYNQTKEKAFLTLKLQDTQETRNYGFDGSFNILLTFTFFDVGSLEQEISIEATNDFSFTFAFHNYFRLQEGIEKAQIKYLQNQNYQDELQNKSIGQQQEEYLKFSQEIDRTYINVGEQVILCDGKTQNIVIQKSQELQDVCIWNPWDEKSQEIKDMEYDDYKDFICVEPGQIVKPVLISKGETWVASQTIYLL